MLDRFQDALQALKVREQDMIALTRHLVEENSHTENIAGVNRVGTLLEQALTLPSLRLDVIRGQRYGNHLVARTPLSFREPAILLIGHHDTVFPPNTFTGWRESEGRAYGPGAFDMKGGLSLVCQTVAALHDVGALEQISLVVVSVADEEIGSPESAPHLLALAKHARCALVFESGRPGDAIVTRRRGIGSVTAVVTGKAAHAGNAHRDGINAIWALAKFVDGAQSLTDYSRGTTVNVGVMHGGVGKNIVPEHAECMIDFRFDHVADGQALLEKFHLCARKAEDSVLGAKLSIDGGVHRFPLMRTPEAAALYHEYAACQRQAGLGAEEAPLAGGGSDANTVAQVGIPAIDGLGPRGDGYHTHNEYVELASFLPKAEALLRFLWGRRSRDHEM